jgi:hypothetical protein
VRVTGTAPVTGLQSRNIFWLYLQKKYYVYNVLMNKKGSSVMRYIHEKKETSEEALTLVREVTMACRSFLAYSCPLEQKLHAMLQLNSLFSHCCVWLFSCCALFYSTRLLENSRFVPADSDLLGWHMLQKKHLNIHYAECDKDVLSRVPADFHHKLTPFSHHHSRIHSNSWSIMAMTNIK